MGNFIDLTGKIFGKLIVLYRDKDHFAPSKKKFIRYVCKCECGQLKSVLADNLRNKNVKSCGCWKNELCKQAATKHGFASEGKPTAEYMTWQAMKQRCLNPNTNHYEDYGGRGIKICSRWLGEKGFENFLSDVGLKPSLTYSLERINNNGDYEPNNCKWATKKEQANNRRVKRIELFTNEELLDELWRRIPEPIIGVAC
ncbi:MAG TPA: hypothetical protein VNX68_17500 [Nitrosopumilaceae archaeon]|jgi:hypothetical protein|nr:hypothetical protein [Nitrosopumilaceae archaeon]